MKVFAAMLLFILIGQLEINASSEKTAISPEAAISTSTAHSQEKPAYAKTLSNKSKKPISKKKNDAIKVTFVELGSVNCMPCKMMQPVMADIEKEYGPQVKVIFYDVWKQENRQYAEIYKVRVIPTQVFLDKDGKEFARHEGYYPKEGIIKILQTQGVEK